MQINRCLSCEQEIDGYPCPHCGFDVRSYSHPEYALPCNTVLHERYLVGKVLGQGGFGITYVGWDLVLETLVAIKEFYPHGQVTRSMVSTSLSWYTTPQATALRKGGLDIFLKEARKMAKVAKIPQLVSVRDTFAVNETAYIIMDYVEGQTLKRRLEQTGPLAWKDAQEIFLPVISAMAKVHEAGLVHRDLSPDNLMLEPEGSVKILDLGAAKDLSINTGVSSMQVAKNGFSPIEQYTQRGGSGPWTDVYAIAATLYYTLTGVLPPSAVDRTYADAISWELPQIQSLPSNVLNALQKAMIVNPPDRTQSMTTLLEELEDAPTASHTDLRAQTNHHATKKQGKSTLKRSKKFENSADRQVPDSNAAGSSKKKRLGICIAAILVAVVGLYWGLYFGASSYAKAGAFQAANRCLLIPQLTKLHDPNLVKYITAGHDMMAGRYDEAKSQFQALSGYLDADEMVKEVDYQHAEQYAKEQQYESAITLFKQLEKEHYSDSSQKVMDATFQKGEYLLYEQKNYPAASGIFSGLKSSGYPGSEEKYKESKLQWATNLINNRDYAKAYKHLNDIRGYANTNSMLSDLKETLFTEGQSAYRNGDYQKATEYFDCIRSYRDSEKYYMLCYVREWGNWGSVTEATVNKLVENFDFEDTPEVLLSGTEVACQFLRGSWSGSGFYFKMSDDGYASYNLPWFDYGDYYKITDGVLSFFPEENEADTRDLFRFTAISPDCLAVYCFKNAKTYTLNRK